MAAVFDFLLSLYGSLLVMRGLMDLAGVSIQPLLNRLIFLATEPALKPFRWILPRSGRLDWSVLMALMIIQFLVAILLTRMAEMPQPWSALVVLAMLRSVQLIALLLLVLVISNFVLRQLSQPLTHPLVPLIGEIVDWLLNPLQQSLPKSNVVARHGIATLVLLCCLILVSTALVWLP